VASRGVGTRTAATVHTAAEEPDGNPGTIRNTGLDIKPEPDGDSNSYTVPDGRPDAYGEFEPDRNPDDHSGSVNDS
jgi:hypothetical protein